MNPLSRAAAVLLRSFTHFLEALQGRLALGCLAILLALSAAIVACRWHEHPIDASLSSLIPAELSPDLPEALSEALREKLAAEESESLIVLLRLASTDGSSLDTWIVQRAADAARSALLENPAIAENASIQSAGFPVIPHAAGNFLSDADRLVFAELLSLPEQKRGERLAERAAAGLMNPASPRALPFAEDPFAAWGRHLASQLEALPWRVDPAGGRTRLTLKDLPSCQAAEVFFFRGDMKTAAAGNAHFAESLEDAERAALEALTGLPAAVRIEAAGVPLFTDAIAARAQKEISLIGLISSLAVLLLAWAFFGRLAAVLLMALSISLGFALAFGASLAVFSSLSLVTFVFGATLIGVSIDYSAHWLALRQPGEDPGARRQRMLPALLSAALSTAGAYGILALAPLPGLRQMALLAAAGVIGTLFTVLTLLPFLERFAPKRETKLFADLSHRLPQIPRLTPRTLREPWGAGIAALFALLLAAGLPRIEFASGFRDLQGAPQALIESQQKVSEELRLPSPAQAFIIEGRSLSEALEREEALLEALAAQPQLARVRPSGLSQMLPSERRQEENFRLYSESVRAAAPGIEALLGAKPSLPADIRAGLEDFADTPLEEAAGRYVLVQDSNHAALALYLSGVAPEHLEALAAAARGIPGVWFSDFTGSMRDGLTLYRDRILETLAAGLLALWALLTLRFGRKSWRAVLPAAAGILTALAVFGLAGVPVTLFTALGLVLLLGLGADYGIFLTGSPADGRTGAAVLFSALTTLLSFGLLAFSATPALSAFGLAVLTGLIAVLLAAPLLRPDAVRP